MQKLLFHHKSVNMINQQIKGYMHETSIIKDTPKEDQISNSKLKFCTNKSRNCCKNLI